MLSTVRKDSELDRDCAVFAVQLGGKTFRVGSRMKPLL
jgi:hypothetical protein